MSTPYYSDEWVTLWLAMCADELELDVETVAEVVGVLAVRRAVDEAAYRRVAARRGVLAL